MTEIKELSDAATQGLFSLNQPDGLSIYMRHEDGVRGRHIADTGRISNQAPKHIVDQDRANAKLICAAVNGIRNGTLVDAKQARRATLKEAVDVIDTLRPKDMQETTETTSEHTMGINCARDALTSLMEAGT